MLLALTLALACSHKDSPADDSPIPDDSPDDSPAEPAWAECPDGPSASGEGRLLTLGGGALYCGTFNEGRTLDEEQAAKAQLRLPEGSIILPTSAVSDAPLTLPACVRFDPDTPGLLSAGEGTVSATFNTWGSDTTFSYQLRQPLDDGRTLAIQLSGLDQGQDLRLDGAYLSVDGPMQASMMICEGRCEYAETLFDSCTFEDVATQRNTITYSGGDIALDLRIGSSFASTEPGVFYQATGTHQGQSWSQTDYWSLVYNPTHHHFSRDARVWLPQPIGEVCAIEALEFDPWGDAPPTQVRTLACDGTVLEEPSVSEDRFERLPSEG